MSAQHGGGGCEEFRTPPALYGTKHSMATAAKSRGADDRAIAAVLGHGDLRSTARYAQLGRKHLRGVVNPGRGVR
jgi:site-specific recombinase XerD